MSKKMLVTLPCHDDTTYYLSNWCKEPLDLASEKMSLLPLKKERANKKEVTSMIEKQNPDFLVFNGHGAEDRITGHRNEILIQLGNNEKLLENKITYAISCKSAKGLGSAFKNSKSTAYIGYDDDFIFLYDSNKITHPLNDNLAQQFFEPSNEVIKTVVKGESAGDAYGKSQKSFKERIKKLLTSDTPKGYINAVRYLWWDMIHQAINGNSSKKL